MTPLYRRLERHMPPLLAQLSLVAIYAFLLFAIIMLIGKDQQAIHYIDAGVR